jgi:hypothetical protein
MSWFEYCGEETKNPIWKRTLIPWSFDPQPGHYSWSAYWDILILTTLTFYGPRQHSQYSDWLRAGRSGDRDFPHPSRLALGAHPVSYTMGTRSFPGVKWPGRGVDHPPPPSSAEVKVRVKLQLFFFFFFFTRARPILSPGSTAALRLTVHPNSMSAQIQ